MPQVTSSKRRTLRCRDHLASRPSRISAGLHGVMSQDYAQGAMARVSAA